MAVSDEAETAETVFTTLHCFSILHRLLLGCASGTSRSFSLDTAPLPSMKHLSLRSPH